MKYELFNIPPKSDRNFRFSRKKKKRERERLWPCGVNKKSKRGLIMKVNTEVVVVKFEKMGCQKFKLFFLPLYSMFLLLLFMKLNIMLVKAELWKKLTDNILNISTHTSGSSNDILLMILYSLFQLVFMKKKGQMTVIKNPFFSYFDSKCNFYTIIDRNINQYQQK